MKLRAKHLLLIAVAAAFVAGVLVWHLKKCPSVTGDDEYIHEMEIRDARIRSILEHNARLDEMIIKEQMYSDSLWRVIMEQKTEITKSNEKIRTIPVNVQAASNNQLDSMFIELFRSNGLDEVFYKRAI